MNEHISIKGHLTVRVKRNGSDTWETVCDRANLLTTAGRDWIHGQLYNVGTTNEANFIAVTSNADPAAAGDTVLTGEIVSGGLERAAGTIVHTPGATTSVVNHTFVSSGTHTNVQKAALFTQITGGTMVHEAIFGTTITLGNLDQIDVIWTVTLS
jgi:hypothetical protein